MRRSKWLAFVSVAAAVASGTAAVEGCGASSQRDDATDGGDDTSIQPGPDANFVDASTDAPTDPFSACATGSATASKSPAFIEVILDGSSSMRDFNKWKAAVAGLDAFFDDVYAKADPDLGLGFIVFADQQDPTYGTGPYPNPNDVAPAFVDQAQHDALRARIDSSSPYQVTPTFAALTGAYKILKSFAPKAPLPSVGQKIVVLMSDGVPTDGPGSQDITAAQNALALAPPQGPIRTFSMGIGLFSEDGGDDYDPNFMGDLAVAGGTRATPQCDPHATNINDVCYFQVTPLNKSAAQLTQDFTAAIDRIREIVIGCEFTLDLDGGSLDPGLVNVVWVDANGKQHVVVANTTDGWTYDDPSAPRRVILHGQSCDDVSKEPDAKVSIVIGCRTVLK